jgi:hypothetical protein
MLIWDGVIKHELKGIEPFAEYRTPNWGHYNVVWRRIIQDHLIFAKETKYDCILFLDVIEHF